MWKYGKLQSYTERLDKLDIIAISVITVTRDIASVTVYYVTFLVSECVPNTWTFTCNEYRQTKHR